MKAPLFEYSSPDTLEEVLDILGEHGDEAKIIAGGQSLIPMMAMRLARPAQVVDINRVTTLAGIERRGEVIALGALTRERAAERSALVALQAPILAESLPHVGHVSIRNRGTIGGSLAHADASAELPAVAMIADAEMVVQNRRGQRVLAAANVFDGHFTTTMSDDECLVEVRLPTTQQHAGWSFQEVARRHGDFALVGAAAMIAVDMNNAISEARICLFGVGDRAIRIRHVEAALVGGTASADILAGAARDAVQDIEPASDMHGSSAYRRHLATVVVLRALTVAAERAGDPS